MTDRMTPKRRKALTTALAEAEAVRTEWQDALRHHELRLNAQFAELRRRLRANAKGRQPRGLPSAKDAEHIRALLDKLHVKSNKGRAKDLRRVEEALRQAIDKLPSE